MDHNHESVPPENIDTTEIFKGHALQDFRTLSPSSPKTREQTLVLRAQFKRLMQNGIFGSYADMISKIREYEKEASCSFRISHSSRLPLDHPEFSTLKYAWLTAKEVVEVASFSGYPDQQPTTSFLSDVVLKNKLPPFTEAYKYREAMKRIEPILEKLKRSGRRRFSKLLRKLDAFADEIVNGGTSDSPDQLPPYPVEANAGDDGTVIDATFNRPLVKVRN
nr:unnamed protein product [Spirometra erinaceieuropaei]